MKTIIFNENQIKEIIHYYNVEKLSCSRISKIFNCSKTPINNLLLKCNILRSGKSNGKKIILTSEDENTIKTLYLESKKSLEEIAKIIGIKTSRLSKHLSKCDYRRSKGESISIRQTGKKRSEEYVERFKIIQKNLAKSGKRKQSGGICKQYEVNGIFCFGTYEKFFIEFLIKNKKECPINTNSLNTPYGVYYPDFSYPENLVEIKSKYTYDVLIGKEINRWTKKIDTIQYKKIKWVNENILPVKIFIVDKKNNKIIEKP